MSNTPFFDALLAEYDEKKQEEILKTLSTPFMSTVKPPLPKRSVAQLIQVPEPDPEFAKKIQEFIQTAPMQILAGTPAGSIIKSMDLVNDDDTGEIMLEAEVLVPPGTIVPTDEIVNAGKLPVDMEEYAKQDALATNAMFNGMRPKLAWIDEWQSGDPKEDEIYIAPPKPITFDRVQSELKADMVAEGVRQQQWTYYQQGVVAGREKATQLRDDRFKPPVMTEKTMPSWIADEVRESNENLSDPEPVGKIKFAMSENISVEDIEKEPGGLYVFCKALAEKYPNVKNPDIHRKDELDGTITISVIGYTPEQTDESVNAASKHADNTSTVKPLWVSHEE